MKLLAPVLALALITGCASPGGGGTKPEPAPGPANAKGSREAQVIVDWEKNFDDADTFFIPTCIVRVPKEGKIAVSKSGRALPQTVRAGAGVVKAGARFKVVGLDRELVRSAAKAACDDFAAKIRASGFKVKTWDDVKGEAWARKVAVAAPGADGLVMDGDVIVAAPSDAQNFKPGLGGQYITSFQSWGGAVYKDQMTLIIPTYVYAAPRLWGVAEGGAGRASVAIDAAPGMNLLNAWAPILTQPGAWGGFRLKGPSVDVSEKVGELAKEDAAYTLTVDKSAYGQGVLDGAAKFNGEVAKILTGLKKH